MDRIAGQGTRKLLRVIGLTGGIASGKSTVSRFLAALGAHIIDTDGIALALAQPGEALYEAYASHFGGRIVAADGSLDRAAIGRIVFADAKEREWIDGVAHPLIKERALAELAECRGGKCAAVGGKAARPVPPPTLARPGSPLGSRSQARPCAAAVLDVPLLFEAGWDGLATETWVVYVTPAVQLARLMERDGYTKAEAKRRIAAQMSLERKRELADVVIDNTAGLANTRRQVMAAWSRPGGHSG